MSLLSFQCEHRFASGFELQVAFDTPHRVTTVFGPSGSGKSSVLSLIAGFWRPQSAQIRIGGEWVTHTARHVHLRPERRRIGYVFQDHLLFPHLSVEANLQYGQRRHSQGKRPISFERVATVLELNSLLTRFPRHLSGGERQRVALGRALLSHPELLLLDEPWAALDESLRNRVLSYLERVVEEWDLPTVFVSHDQVSVRRLAEWVVVLNHGKVVTCGPPTEALSRPELLGWRDLSGPMNLLRVERPQLCEGAWVGAIGTQDLHLPPLAGPPAEPLFVQFSPREVTLSRHEIEGISARNHLHGTIRQIVQLPQGVFLAIDAGQIIWADVTSSALRELDLQIGTEVVCLIKTVALEVVSS
jgi:molybdate transport system ATP-binding protein